MQVKLLVQQAVLLGLVSKIRSLQALVYLLLTALQILQRRKERKQLLLHGIVVIFQFLLHNTDFQALGRNDLAAGWGKLAGQQAEEAGFAGPVDANQAAFGLGLQ